MSMQPNEHADPWECIRRGEVLLPPLEIPRNEWWTQNRRGHWRTGFAHTRAVKHRAIRWGANARNTDRAAYDRIRNADTIQFTVIEHPLTHGRFDPENSAPMVKAVIDALTATGWWADDDGSHIIGPDYRPGAPSARKGWYALEFHLQPFNIAGTITADRITEGRLP